jgi:hypothetical protein
MSSRCLPDAAGARLRGEWPRAQCSWRSTRRRRSAGASSGPFRCLVDRLCRRPDRQHDSQSGAARAFGASCLQGALPAVVLGAHRPEESPPSAPRQRRASPARHSLAAGLTRRGLGPVSPRPAPCHLPGVGVAGRRHRRRAFHLAADLPVLAGAPPHGVRASPPYVGIQVVGGLVAASAPATCLMRSARSARACAALAPPPGPTWCCHHAPGWCSPLPLGFFGSGIFSGGAVGACRAPYPTELRGAGWSQHRPWHRRGRAGRDGRCGWRRGSG